MERVSTILFFIILNFLTMNNMSTQANYKILPIKDLSQIAERKRGLVTESYIVPYNKVNVTVFSDGTSILRPPVLGGDKGFYFENVKDMLSMVENRTYPIGDGGTFWEKEKEWIKDMDKYPERCREKLAEVLDINVLINPDSTYLDELSVIINNKSKKIKKDNMLYLAIYIAEILRIQYDAKWQLMPHYSFHVYYTPELVKDQTFCDPLSYIISQLEMISFLKLDINGIIKNAAEFYPYTNSRYQAN